MDDSSHCKLIFGALKEDGISITVNKKVFKHWVASVSSIRGMAHRKGFGVSVDDGGSTISITRIKKGVRGRPRKDVL